MNWKQIIFESIGHGHNADVRVWATSGKQIDIAISPIPDGFVLVERADKQPEKIGSRGLEMYLSRLMGNYKALWYRVHPKDGPPYEEWGIVK